MAVNNRLPIAYDIYAKFQPTFKGFLGNINRMLAERHKRIHRAFNSNDINVKVFGPKPFNNEHGSGLHYRIVVTDSLWKDDLNEEEAYCLKNFEITEE